MIGELLLLSSSNKSAQAQAERPIRVGSLPVDSWLLGSVLILVSLSVLMVYSATGNTAEYLQNDSLSYIKRHVAHIMLGLLMMATLYRVNPYSLQKVSLTFVVIGLILLVLVLIPGIGIIGGGARRWLVLGGMRFQPSEFVKAALVLYMATYIGRWHGEFAHFKVGALIPFCIVAGFSALLLVEPDFGSSVVILAVVLGQFFSVSRFRHLCLIGMVGLLGLGCLILVSPYRLRRFESFLDPFRDASNSGYQLVQSLIAVGSGGITGRGLGASEQKLFYLPAAHTDFIFAVISEELGLIGALGVVLLFVVIGLRGVRTARRLAIDRYLSSLALGVTLLLTIPALLNMGVVLGLLPTKGLVLPFLSYGGSSMVVNLALTGVLLCLSRIEVE